MLSEIELTKILDKYTEKELEKFKDYIIGMCNDMDYDEKERAIEHVYKLLWDIMNQRERKAYGIGLKEGILL